MKVTIAFVLCIFLSTAFSDQGTQVASTKDEIPAADRNIANDEENNDAEAQIADQTLRGRKKDQESNTKDESDALIADRNIANDEETNDAEAQIADRRPRPRRPKSRRRKKNSSDESADVSPLPFNLRDYSSDKFKRSMTDAERSDENENSSDKFTLNGDAAAQIADRPLGDENDDAEDVEEDEEYEDDEEYDDEEEDEDDEEEDEYEDYEDDEEYDDEEEDEDDDEDYAYHYIVHDNQSDDDDLEKIVEVYSNDQIPDEVIEKIVADDAYYM